MLPYKSGTDNINSASQFCLKDENREEKLAYAIFCVPSLSGMHNLLQNFRLTVFCLQDAQLKSSASSQVMSYLLGSYSDERI